MKKRLNDEQKVDLVNKYKSGEYTCRQLSEQFNLTKSSIYGLLERRNVERPNKRPKRKYYLNESYFDVIDTEAKAYFLGLLYADGCNVEKYKTIRIKLQEEDREILEKFNKELEYQKPLIFQKRQKPHWKNMWLLYFRSERISNRLAELGCFQAKSLTLKFPTEEQVPKNLIRHFIRGYFDGDGTVGFHKGKKRYNFTPKIISTESFCYDLQKILTEFNIYGFCCKDKRYSKTTTSSYCLGGRIKALYFFEWIYKDCDFYLDRKYKKYLEAKNYYAEKDNATVANPSTNDN